MVVNSRQKRSERCDRFSPRYEDSGALGVGLGYEERLREKVSNASCTSTDRTRIIDLTKGLQDALSHLPVMGADKRWIQKPRPRLAYVDGGIDAFVDQSPGHEDGGIEKRTGSRKRALAGLLAGDVDLRPWTRVRKELGIDVDLVGRLHEGESDWWTSSFSEVVREFVDEDELANSGMTKEAE